MATDRTAVSATRGEVPEAFDEVADRYDLMVALNPGYHAHLRHSAAALVAGLVPGQGSRVVDLGCGSGASTRALVEELNRAGVRAEVLGVDGSAGMLVQARKKSWPSWVRFEPGRAEGLDQVCGGAGFQPLDGVFAAYLLRNVPDRDALLRSLHGLLRPGGTLVVHEYSVAGRPMSEAVWTAVCQGVVVPLGWLTSRPHPAVPLPVAQRHGHGLRRDGHAADARRGVRGRPDAVGAGLAARDHPHVPRAPPRMIPLRPSRDRWVPGRDSRAVQHAPPRPSVAVRADRPSTAVVVGGGIAGLAAATGLAERGVAVTLVEAAPTLGGRARAWPVAVDGSATSMSRGFHAFFRQYYNLRALLRRTDPTLARLRPVADYPLVLAGGHTDSFAGLPTRPPLNLMAFVARSPSFTLRDLARVDADAALGLLDVAFPRTYEDYAGRSAAAVLDELPVP